MSWSSGTCPSSCDDDPREYSLAAGAAAGGPFSIGILHGRHLLGAVGLMPDRPGSAELAYWVRPGQRGRGIAAQAVRASTPGAHRSLGICRDWACENAEKDS